ncbi:hypothetical protein PIB30_062395 [Stylosanthes scabra]|uniref:Uncharacterized protein n=1 Tax=Stylosanthes scabra TaxID=79078 RepID=A0ABU6ZJW0_9FABA|nr:hypothetical protein [Stylosanthes scabra]
MERDVKSFEDVFPLRANAYIRIPILGSQLSSTTSLVFEQGITGRGFLAPTYDVANPRITWGYCLNLLLWTPQLTYNVGELTYNVGSLSKLYQLLNLLMYDVRNRYDLGYDSEPERTLLRRRREARRARQDALEQQLNMAAENNDDNFNMENQNRITLGQYINPTADSCGSTIRRPAIQANNFEL